MKFGLRWTWPLKVGRNCDACFVEDFVKEVMFTGLGQRAISLSGLI